MNFHQFFNDWLGKRVDTDYYPRGRYYQCVDLVKIYVSQVAGLPILSYGDAVNYWTDTHPKLLEKFERIPTQHPKTGDIVVLHGKPGNPYGHIGLATGKHSGSFFEMLEQNGYTGNGLGKGKDRIRTRFIPEYRVMGVLRLKASHKAPKHATGLIRPYSWYVRSVPAVHGRIIGVALRGQRYEIIDSKHGWRKVHFRGREGWIGPKAWA